MRPPHTGACICATVKQGMPWPLVIKYSDSFLMEIEFVLESNMPELIPIDQ